jgi:hypothetical protein
VQIVQGAIADVFDPAANAKPNAKTPPRMIFSALYEMTGSLLLSTFNA